MKQFIFFFILFLSVNSPISAQSDTIPYGILKNMPVFYEQLKQQLTYPEAWGNSSIKDFKQWKTNARNIVMECMQNLPPAPGKYNDTRRNRTTKWLRSP